MLTKGWFLLTSVWLSYVFYVINWVAKKDDKLSVWIKALQKRMNPGKVVVAVANKLARISWAVMSTQVEYVAR